MFRAWTTVKNQGSNSGVRCLQNCKLCFPGWHRGAVGMCFTQRLQAQRVGRSIFEIENRYLPAPGCSLLPKGPQTAAPLSEWLGALTEGCRHPIRASLPLLLRRALPRRWVQFASVFRVRSPAPKLHCFLLCIETGVIQEHRAGRQGFAHQERTKQGPPPLWKQ